MILNKSSRDGKPIFSNVLHLMISPSLTFHLLCDVANAQIYTLFFHAYYFIGLFCVQRERTTFHLFDGRFMSVFERLQQSGLQIWD